MVLFFLFIMSLMALSLLNSSYLELRMSQNMASIAQRFQAAEAGLRLAEHRLSSLSMFSAEIYEHFNYAGFQINAALKKHKIHYCINQRLAYIYDVIVEAKQTIGEVITLKTTYAIKTKTACSGELTLSKAGRSSWRELSGSTKIYPLVVKFFNF
ncbi:MAG: uncharacterized protein RLY40_284 [Pseudomonadota bacterium]|jgi:Tfp pilus assembly protein PilX